MKKRMLINVGLLLVLLLAVGVSNPTLAAAAVPTPTVPEQVKLAYVIFLSGPAATWGIPLSRGFQIMVDDINFGGGFWGKPGFTIDGRPHVWKYLLRDHAYNPKLAADVAHRLIYQDEVHFIFMGGGACVKAAAPIANQAGNVLFCAPAGIGKEVINPNFPLTFKFDPNPPEVNAPDLYKAMQNRENVKRMAILGPNDEAGQIWAQGAMPVAGKLGIEIVIQEYFERATTDFFPLLTRTLAKKPDMIDLSYVPSGIAAAIVKQGWELGFRGKWLLYAVDPNQLLEIAGQEAAEGAYDWMYTAEPYTDFQKWFVNEYKSRYGEWNPLGLAHAGYLYGVTKAIETAQSLDAVKVADALEDLEWESNYGPQHFSGDEHFGIKRQALFPVPVAQVKGGKLVHAFTLPAAEKY